MINFDKLKKQFDELDEQPFIEDMVYGRNYTYMEAKLATIDLANYLKTKLISPHDNVAIYLPNSADYIVVYFALMTLGVTAVPINDKLNQQDISHILADSNSKLLITTKNLLDNDIKFPKKVIQIDLYDYKLRGKHDIKSNIKIFEKLHSDTIIAIMYTSGTTSKPKGVCICADNIIRNGYYFIDRMDIKPKSRFLSIFSLAYMGGWYNLTLIPFLSGGTIIIDKTFNISTIMNFWDTLKNKAINVLWLSPTMMAILNFAGLNQKLYNYCKENIYLGLVGTAPLAPKLKRDFEEISGVKFYDTYGLTETTFISSEIPRLDNVSGSVGNIFDTCRVQIIDKNGLEVRRGQDGEIAIKTPYLMKGYLKNGKIELPINNNGFFLTGDIGYVGRNGELFISGRKKDIIIKGGLNISPKVIEDQLMELEYVQEVACVGIQDDIYGEEIAAVIKLKKNFQVEEEQVMEYISKHIDLTLRPKKIMFVDNFPKSVTGKIKKNLLKINIS